MDFPFKLGVVPSLPDPRDYKITKLVPMLNVFPTKFSLDISKIKVKNQQNVSSCVAHSLASIKELQELKERGKVINFSTQFLYANRVGEDYIGDGMITSECLANLKRFGVCEESLMPGNYEVPEAFDKFKEAKTPELMNNAKKYIIKSYARLHDADDIKTALMQIGAVAFSIPVYANFYETPSDGIVPTPKGQLLGYHQMICIGFDDEKNSWLLLNSWGEKWANNGTCFYNYDFRFDEAFSVTDHIEVNETEKFYRVLIGKFRNRNDATKFMTKFKLKGFLVMKNEKISIQLGAFKDKASTTKLMKQYAKFKPFIILD